MLFDASSLALTAESAKFALIWAVVTLLPVLTLAADMLPAPEPLAYECNVREEDRWLTEGAAIPPLVTCRTGTALVLPEKMSLREAENEPTRAGKPVAGCGEE